ncbi:MAG: DNA-protecting protein DprA, partial [Sphingomonadales bacterium]|nr:DNA-protecting protein DprA [Sphingomonadales bacterium]
TLVQTVDDVLEALAPMDERMLREPGGPFDEEPPAKDVETGARRIVAELLGPVPVGIGELIRQSGQPPAVVQTVLLELELAGRLERHAGGRVSLGG